MWTNQILKWITRLRGKTVLQVKQWVDEKLTPHTQLTLEIQKQTSLFCAMPEGTPQRSNPISNKDSANHLKRTAMWKKSWSIQDRAFLPPQEHLASGGWQRKQKSYLLPTAPQSLGVSDILWKQRRQQKKITKDKCVIAQRRECGRRLQKKAKYNSQEPVLEAQRDTQS